MPSQLLFLWLNFLVYFCSMRCKRCNSLIREHEIEIDQAIECWKCGTIQELTQAEIDRLLNPQPIPENFDILELRSELNVFMNWKRSIQPFILLFAVAWNGFLLLFATIMIASGEWTSLWMLSLHGLAGIGLIYYVVSQLVNKSVLTVNDRYLTFNTRPLPWIFHKAIREPVQELDQLYCRKYVSATVNGRPQHAYKVVAERKNFDEIDLVKGLKTLNQALFLEQKIEHYLGIKDRSVPGSENANIS